MVIDTSALVAILLQEPEQPSFVDAILAAGECLLSTASLLECTTVMIRRNGIAGSYDLELYINTAGIALVAFDEDQARLARRAYREFGKGRHLAGLNFGDCFSYALARSLQQPLLFKGHDFHRTDVECHPASTRYVAVNEPAAHYGAKPRKHGKRI